MDREFREKLDKIEHEFGKDSKEAQECRDKHQANIIEYLKTYGSKTGIFDLENHFLALGSNSPLSEIIGENFMCSPLEYALAHGYDDLIKFCNEHRQGIEAEYFGIDTIILCAMTGSSFVMGLALNEKITKKLKKGETETAVKDKKESTISEEEEKEKKKEETAEIATIMQIAINYGQDRIVKLLMEKYGVEVKNLGDISNTLMLCCKKGIASLIPQLFSAGAKTNILDEHNMTPLSTVCQH